MFYMLEEGPRDGRVVLCLHGFPDFAPSFAPLLDALGKAGFRAIAPWMRGYAPSPVTGPYDADGLARDICELARALSPNAPVSLVGHDWGAVATYQALSSFPELFDAAVTLAVPYPTTFLANAARAPAQIRRSAYMALLQLPGATHLVRWNELAWVDRIWRSWSPGFAPPEAEMRARKECLSASLPGPIRYYRALTWPILSALRRLQASHRQRIRTPLLHLTGADDGCIAPAMGSGQELHFSESFDTEVIPGAGHFVHLERPDVVHPRIVDFLKNPSRHGRKTQRP
jgi:pimeloyl-ACP methyl ester carboxylesterase